MGKINVALDIDGVLACHSVSSIENGSFYLRKGAIISAIKTHYVFPGVIEFLQLLLQTENIKLSFFSSGEKKRNEILVRKLLKLSLGKECYKKFANDITIYSRENLVPSDNSESRLQYKFFNLNHGNQKKDLKITLKEGDLIKNAILIDDNSTYCQYGQEENLLKVPPSKDENFKKLKKQQNKYDTNGFAKIKCYLEKEISKFTIEKVIQSKKIIIQKNKTTYEILYHHLPTCQCNKISLLPDVHHELIESFDLLLKEGDLITIKDVKICEKIYEIVSSNEGKTEKICFSANRIYYLTGLLFKAIEKAKKKKKPVSNILFHWQYKEKREPCFYEPCFNNLSRKEDLYWLGLRKLRQINSDLTFTTPHNYMCCINLPPSEEEQIALKEALENQSNDCIVM